MVIAVSYLMVHAGACSVLCMSGKILGRSSNTAKGHTVMCTVGYDQQAANSSTGCKWFAWRRREAISSQHSSKGEEFLLV